MSFCRSRLSVRHRLLWNYDWNCFGYHCLHKQGISPCEMGRRKLYSLSLNRTADLAMIFVQGNSTGREPDTELLAGGDFTFDLVAKATFATNVSMLELASC